MITNMPKLAKKKSVDKHLKDKCLKAAKAVCENYHKIASDAAKYERELAGGDPWGPSVADMRDATEKMNDDIAKIIYKHVKKS